MTRQKQAALQLAQQGNPQGIAMCINHKLQPFGITAQVKVQDSCLHILLESDKPLNQEKLTSFVTQVVFRLQLTSTTAIKALVIYGKRTGETKFLWKQQKLLTRQEAALPTTQSPQPQLHQSQLQQMVQQRIAKMVVDKANDYQSIRIDSLASSRSIVGTATKPFDESDNTVDALFAYF